MSHPELIIALTEIAEKYNNDPEYAHMQADKLLLDYVGSQEVIDAFRKISRRY
jgi:hypothetical protein